VNSNPVSDAACVLPPVLTSLPAVREFAAAQTHQAGLAEDDCALLTVAAVEVFTNIVRHARGMPAHAQVRLSAHCSASTLMLQVQHPGEAFTPPEQSQETDFAAFPEGGFGLTIIHQACDRVEYLHHQGINTVRLHRARPSPQEPTP